MADDVIKRLVTQFVIDAGDALTKGKQMAEMTQKVKAEIRALMEQGLSMKDAWSGLFSANITQKIEATRASIARLKAELKSMDESGVSTIGGGTSSTKAELQAQQVILAQLNKEAKAYGVAGRNAQAEIAKEVQNLNRAYQANVSLQKNVAGSLQQTASAANSARSGFAGLGDAAKYVFGTVLGIGAIQVLQKIIAYLNQAMQSGFELSKGIFQLDVAVRALRRSGLDITLQEVYSQLDKLQAKFGVFSRKELREGAAAFFNLNRDLNLTKEQLFAIQDAVATLAVVNGRSMDEVQRTVALALSSGYTEGLQRLGVSINRVTIAEQAAVMGWKQGYTALTENQRAQATAILLLEKTLKYEEDLAAYQKTLPGQIESNTKAWEDYTAAIGEASLPLKEIGSALLEKLGEALLYVIPIIVGATIALEQLIHLISSAQTSESFSKAFKEGADAAAKYANLISTIYSNVPMEQKLSAISEYVMPTMGENAFVPLDDSAEKLAAEVSDILDTLEKEFQDILTDHERKLRDLETDFLRDIAKIDRDLANDLAEIDRDLQNKKDECVC